MDARSGAMPPLANGYSPFGIEYPHGRRHEHHEEMMPDSFYALAVRSAAGLRARIDSVTRSKADVAAAGQNWAGVIPPQPGWQSWASPHPANYDAAYYRRPFVPDATAARAPPAVPTPAVAAESSTMDSLLKDQELLFSQIDMLTSQLAESQANYRTLEEAFQASKIAKAQIGEGAEHAECEALVASLRQQHEHQIAALRAEFDAHLAEVNAENELKLALLQEEYESATARGEGLRARAPTIALPEGDSQLCFENNVHSNESQGGSSESAQESIPTNTATEDADAVNPVVLDYQARIVELEEQLRSHELSRKEEREHAKIAEQKLHEQLASLRGELDEIRDYYTQKQRALKLAQQEHTSLTEKHTHELQRCTAALDLVKRERAQLQHDVAELQRRHDSQRSATEALEHQLRNAHSSVFSRAVQLVASPADAPVHAGDEALRAQLSEQIEVNARLRELLVAVGVGGSKATEATKGYKVEEIEAMTRERVQQDMEMEAELDGLRSKAALADILIEERDAWKASTRQLEAMVLQLSKQSIA